jgi:hypothetical protein
MENNNKNMFGKSKWKLVTAEMLNAAF